VLQKLSIHNYAIITQLNINFADSLNIITGETGAGKSIVMGALGLILGNRADTNVLRDATKKCFVEGIFNIANKQDVQQFLIQQELDNIDNELVIRREINANGKSRAFINDTPVTIQLLKQITCLLVDLHQQFDTADVADNFFQQTVIDALANNQQFIQQYQQVYKQWQTSKKLYEKLVNEKTEFQKEADYHQFLFDELSTLQLEENELENIEQELKVLNNVEHIKSTLSNSYYQLIEGEQPINTALKQINQQLQSISGFQPNIEALTQRIQSTYVELQDIANEIESINDETNFDAQRIEIINDRLTVGYKLLKKHNVKTTFELLEIKNSLEQKLQSVLAIDDSLQQADEATKKYFEQASKFATTIAAKRKEQIAPLEKSVQQMLYQVGMPNAVLKVHIANTGLNNYGNNEISFLFDANKSNKFEPIGKVASGGELSRLMLCIKSLVANSVDFPTMIFDEIDTGISGEAAKQVGVIMKSMALKRQIICITHQPQIAGKANAHFYVYKHIENDTVVTNMKLLTETERITAIAQMLSGEKPTAAALENAREMILN
jgi:DNA repair protein RecN (Recombination protein N)